MQWKIVLGVLLSALLGYYVISFFDDSFDPNSLRNKRVVVTGASYGIGEQMAYHYARMGAKLFITARTESRLKEVIAKCRDVGQKDGEYHSMAADMMEVNAYKELIEASVSALGGIDYLVLNHALIPHMGKWLSTSENFTLLQSSYDVNFRSYIHLASYAIPHLEKSCGGIVVVSSILGRLGHPYMTPYVASKFALDGFFSSWRQELEMSKSSIAITVCIIGLTGTSSALKSMTDFCGDEVLDKLSPSSAEDSALAIIKGGATRAREVYYPYIAARSTTLLRDWIPTVLENVMQSIMKSKESA